MTDPRRTIDTYFAAMRVGAAAEAEMLALFTDDAVYEEPFTGSAEPAVGIDSIRNRLLQGWAHPLPDMELDVLEIEVTGNDARSRWECRSPALARPVIGEDRYSFTNGKISRLEVTLLDDGSEDDWPSKHP